MEVATEQEWQAARKELLAAERELAAHERRVTKQRRELPWVPSTTLSPPTTGRSPCRSCSMAARSSSSIT